MEFLIAIFFNLNPAEPYGYSTLLLVQHLVAVEVS
jgi:hypothetical protein